MAKSTKPAAEPTTGAESNAAQLNLEDLHDLDVPVIHTNAFQAATTGSDVLISLFTPKLVVNKNELPVAASNKVAAVLALSPQGAKDLALMLADIVKKHETTYGVLNTPFTQRQAAAAADHGRRKKGH